MRVLVFAPPIIKDIKSLSISSSDYIIACDNALFCLDKLNIKVNLAIGDFDSLEDKSLLSNYEHKTLKTEKDETDSFEAIKHAYTLSDDVILVGGIGGSRFEHSLANMNLFSSFPNLIIITDNSKMFLLSKVSQEIKYNHFISIFPFPNAIISLEGFKYPLDEYDMKIYDSIGISNELVGTTGVIHIHEGQVIVVLTKE